MEERKDTTQPAGKLILCIEARDLGDEVVVTAATNGRVRNILQAWAEASARLLDDIGVPTGLAIVLLETAKKMDEQGEESDD